MTELSAIVQSFCDNWGDRKVSGSRPYSSPHAEIVTPAGTMGSTHTSRGRTRSRRIPGQPMDVSRMVTAGDGGWVTGNLRGTQTGDLCL
jgi:hypothetical protein